jgi:hypothetical protein
MSPFETRLPYKPVAGEIFHVNAACLERLDRLEGVDHKYDRKVEDVMEDGKHVKHSSTLPGRTFLSASAGATGPGRTDARNSIGMERVGDAED